MTDNGKGTIMGRPSCELVRPWLPLMVEEEGETIAGEGFDQGILDREQIERHLATCPDCRQYRARLQGAVSILAAAAAEMPAEPALGSLWPELKERVSRQHAQPLSTRVRSGGYSARIRSEMAPTGSAGCAATYAVSFHFSLHGPEIRSKNSSGTQSFGGR